MWEGSQQRVLGSVAFETEWCGAVLHEAHDLVLVLVELGQTQQPVWLASNTAAVGASHLDNLA